ncbi:MAG: S8 family serine peptidase [Acidobacteriota bacterium]|nr:S8 family serine peptidase [Acidobacteriota bacterium]
MKSALPTTRKLFSFFAIFIFAAGCAAFMTQTGVAKSSHSSDAGLIRNLLLHPEASGTFSNSSLTNIFETTSQRAAKKTINFAVKPDATDSKPKAKDEKVFDQLIDEAKDKGKVRVIVGLNVDFVPEGNLAESDLVEQQRAQISVAQENLIGRIKQFGVENVKKFEFIPYMAFETDANAVAFMKYSPEVNFIQEDRAGTPTLLESTRVSGASYSWAAGLGGSGWTVAILDSGVDKNHPFLSGKVVSEACYSSNVNASNGTYTSVCPGGVTSSTMSGSGVNCSTSVSGCDHGTHVAGIAAGNNSSSDADGVARDSNIIAIQIFSRNNSNNSVGYFTSDMIKGLERVYALRNTYSIAAVNMSIGIGGGSTTTCDAGEAASKTAIDNLRSAGIATVVSSGNDGFVNGLTAPACISSAISVGSVRDGGSNVTTGSVDTPSSFSNSASFLSLLAPGEMINSSVPGGGYADKPGTSMAAPHVTGAWAILKQRMGGSATVQQILDRLNSTGVSVTDSRNNITKKSIRIDTAVYVGCNASLSGTSANFNASGGNGSFNLNITGCGWNAISNDSWITTTSSSSGGSGTITYTVAPNNSTSSRTSTISVAGQRFTVTQSGVSCTTPSLSSYSASVPAGGGSGSFIVNSPSACGGWTAESSQFWASLSTNGTDTLYYNVSANNTASTRTATITVRAPGGNLTFTITQDGISCNSTLTPSNVSVNDFGGTGSFSVSRPSACASWTAISTVAWITVTAGGSGTTGNGTVSYSIAANTNSGQRTGTISVSGGSTFTVTQDPAPSCTYSLGSTGRIVDADAGSFSFGVTTNRSHCSWSSSVTSGSGWLSVTSGSGTGSGSVSYSVTANPSSTSARIGTITTGGQTFTVRQSAANLPCSPVTSNLISWFRGENNTNDSIGGYDPGTFFGSVTYTTGRSGQAINFGGNGAFSIQRQIGDDFSIEFWLKTSSAGGSGETNWYQGVGLVDAEVSGVTNDFGVSLGNGKILFGVGNPDTTIRSANTVNDNQWHHVVAARRKSDGSIRLYIDGVLSANGTGGTQSLTIPTQITFGKLQTGGYYVGQLDEIKLYEDDLSATQVTSAYNGCASAQPSISISDRSLNEGNSGTTNASFTVSLSAASAVNVSVNYATQDVMATAGSDYTATSGTLTIPAGQMGGTINVPVIGDTSAESNETFKVVLSNAANATIADNEGLGTITNDDSSCNYSISPTFHIFPASASNLNISVTAPAGCSWTATTALDWVSITSGASGNGNGTVTIAVPANTSTNTRNGVITIAGIEFSVGQQGAAQNCTYSLSHDSQTFTSSGGTETIIVTAPAGCAWTVSNPLNWVSITSGASGNGNGSTTISVQPNPSYNIRYGFVTIAGIQFFVGQEAIPTYSISGLVSYGITPAGQAVKYVSGVQMSLTGASSQNINTSSTGAYSFTGLPGGNYVVTPTKTTQISGITAFDATLVLRCVAAGASCTLTANQKKAADSDNDGGTTAFDATQILRFVAANGSNANTGQAGKWKFVQPSYSYTPLSSSVSGQNLTAILVGEVDGDWSPTAALTEVENEVTGNLELVGRFNNFMFSNASYLKLLGVIKQTRQSWL